MTAPTLARDIGSSRTPADQAAIMTATEAASLAEAIADVYEATSVEVLARWVLRHAPVFEAAEQWQAARAAGLRFPPSHPAGRDYEDACDALDARIAVAREGGAL